ncbi:9966_t:CDS:2 [Cetraspora pellucida]|uniref:9966_t:CDS:1 n=1 Tax=Cetraspora pellucida TaxID=1433469 RepID=A0A9N9F957_9GLOM|nr:9966_t:CDS:2 [Cetraspora pellucida]
MLGNLETTRENVVDIDSVASSYHSEASDIFDKDLQTLRELARKSTECARNTSSKTAYRYCSSRVYSNSPLPQIIHSDHCKSLRDSFYRQSEEKRPWQKEIMREVWNFCELHDIRIQEFLWVPSQLNPADKLTHSFDKTDWTHSQELFKFINQR